MCLKLKFTLSIYTCGIDKTYALSSLLNIARLKRVNINEIKGANEEDCFFE